MISVFATIYTAKQGVTGAECTEALGNDYATGATLHLQKIKDTPCECPLSFGGVGFGFELGPVRSALRDAGSHIRLSNRCPLARYRERRDIFAIGEYPAKTHFNEFLSKP